MRYLPVSLKLAGRPVVVIGGGEIARRRVRALIACEARVTVIAPLPADEIVSLSGAGSIRLLRREYEPGDLTGAELVLTATDDRRVNHDAWTEAQAAGIPINVADDPDKCDFIMPAVVERGALTIAISTSGKSPALAARLRRRISGMLGPEYARLLEVLDDARRRLKSTRLTFDQKRRVLYRLVDSDLDRLIREGDTAAVRRRVDAAIREAAEDTAGRDSSGRVYIVGAGPGDPGLITVRGLECVRAADVVLHDRLIDKRLLDEVRPGAEVIDVGKRPGDGGRLQDFIHRTMVERAGRGQTVCRLKGGDPFVFGRGGEEARALTEADVPFEIIPGVTSAIAAPAAAAIPVTHRDAAHAFMVMTGSRADEAAGEEWTGAASLIAGGGTLLVLMGLAHLERIVARLVEGGCRPDTPAAVVSRGTFDDQDVRVGTLGSIRERAEGVASPAVIVFGAVVRERGRLEELRERRSGELK